MSKERKNEAADIAEMMNDDLVGDISEGGDVLEKQYELRDKIKSSDLLSEEDREVWNRKLENARNNLSASTVKSLQQDFEKEQKAIKTMVDTYTRKVIENKDEAFTIDSTRNLDTARDYLKWFESSSYSEKREALRALDADIEERKDLRRKLLKRFDQKDVIKMRRSEMKDKLKELESVEKNLTVYKSMLQKDKDLFHDTNLYIEAFEDLTPKEQEDWIRKYEEEIAKPRRELIETHNTLPARFQHSGFLKMPSGKKREYLEMTEEKIERDYISQIKRIPEETWSEESKRFAIDDFMRLDSISKKAQWLEFLPSAIKAEEKLVKEYKSSKFNKVKQIPDYSKRTWERSRFEEKEKMLKSMEAELTLFDTFSSIMDKSLKSDVISEKTRDRYMDIYNNGSLNDRRNAVKTIMVILSPRRALLQDFEKLSPETRKRFSDFYDRGHKARLEIYKEAKIFESENITEEKDLEEKDTPESLEKNDVIKIVEKLQRQAEESEHVGNIEKALGLHEAVLAMHPENELSKKKIDQLNMELDALETASDEVVLEAIENNLNNNTAQAEIKYMNLAQQVLEDKEDVVTQAHGNESLRKQSAHLGSNSFEAAVHEELVDISGGKKIVDSEWRAQNVKRVDVGRLGMGSNDATPIENDLKILSNNENLENVQLFDSDTGKNLNLREAKERLLKRKKNLAKRIGSEEKLSIDKIDERIAA